MFPEKLALHDLRPESISLQDVQKRNAALINQAQKELEVIAPSLHDLSQKIEEEKPDFVFFLDKGARIFSAPFRKYMQNRLGEKAPRIGRYNDDRLKNSLSRKESIDTILHEDFFPLSGKKIFFVDETFWNGRGFAALEKAAAQSGIKMKYFALSYDSRTKKSLHTINTDSDQEEETPLQKIHRLKTNPRFMVYPNNISILFSKKASLLCVIDEKEKTKSRYALKEDVSKNIKKFSLPNARDYEKTPQNDWEEFDQAAREENMRTVRTLTHMIYETLRKENEKEVSLQ